MWRVPRNKSQVLHMKTPHAKGVKTRDVPHMMVAISYIGLTQWDDIHYVEPHVLGCHFLCARRRVWETGRVGSYLPASLTQRQMP